MNDPNTPEDPVETLKNLAIVAGAVALLMALYIIHARLSFYLLP